MEKSLKIEKSETKSHTVENNILRPAGNDFIVRQLLEHGKRRACEKFCVNW